MSVSEDDAEAEWAVRGGRTRYGIAGGQADGTARSGDAVVDGFRAEPAWTATDEVLHPEQENKCMQTHGQSRKSSHWESATRLADSRADSHGSH